MESPALVNRRRVPKAIQGRAEKVEPKPEQDSVDYTHPSRMYVRLPHDWLVHSTAITHAEFVAATS